MTPDFLDKGEAGNPRDHETSSAREVPEFFTDPEDEFRAAMSGAVILGRPSFGSVEVTGADRLDLLHRLSTNDLMGLRPSRVSGTIFLTDRGRIVDLVFVAVLESAILLLVSPGNEERIIAWIQKYSVLEDIALRRVTEETGMISIVGNRALEVFGAIGGVIEAGNRCNADGFAGLPLLAVGIETKRWQGIHLLGSRSDVLEARIELTERGEGRGLAAAGSRAHEWYRVASGMPALGKELAESFNPYDTGLIEFVNFKKGCYIGQEVIARLDTYQKATRSLSGLVFGQSPQEGATGAPIMREGKEIGMVTSVAPGAIGGVHLGLGVIRSEEIQRGSILQVAGIRATLRSLPMFPPYS